MILLDTSILVYAVGSEHELRNPCRMLFEANGKGFINAGITVGVVQEFLHVRSRRYGRSDALQLARDFVEALTVFPSDPSDIERSLVLYERYPKLGSFDAQLAALALNRHMKALVSADTAFSSVEELHWISPNTPDLVKLLTQ